MARKSYGGFDALGKMFGGNRNNNRGGGFGNDRGNKPPVTTPATAPYNFVSLPSAALPAPIEQNGERFSGEIALDITALTPLFIGGNAIDSARSFAPIDLDSPILPGSSLRGMFKNIFKIVTLGAFRGRTSELRKGEDFTDEHICFRCLMTTRSSPPWMTDLNKLYNSRMIGMKRGKNGKMSPAKNARPGFLLQTRDGKFWIAPSMQKLDRILIKEYERKFNDRLEIRGSRVTWQKREAYIITGSQPPFKLHDSKSYEKLDDFAKKKAGKQFIRYTSIDHVDWAREHWTLLDDDVRSSYEHDRNRRGVNLFKCDGNLDRKHLQSLVKNLPPDVFSLVPCHFLEEDGRVTAFGHGQCFRIPYKHRIGELVPKKLQLDAPDFSDVVFGRAAVCASRVFFEDAQPLEPIKHLPTAVAHPLMQPNPTSYQLYLKQNSATLNHWDGRCAQIRGYKLYWHNTIDNWQATPAEKELVNVTRKITPLQKNSRFNSKIRFQNLTAIELGALLMIFDLNGATNAAYKLGMGKSLGFGSIKVTPKLFVENENAYDELVNTDGWIDPLRAEDAKTYIDAFKNYIDENGLHSDWLNVMKELNAILNFEQTSRAGWSGKVASMSGNVQSGDVDERFKQRTPLPSIFEVVR